MTDSTMPLFPILNFFCVIIFRLLTASLSGHGGWARRCRSSIIQLACVPWAKATYMACRSPVEGFSQDYISASGGPHRGFGVLLQESLG